MLVSGIDMSYVFRPSTTGLVFLAWSVGTLEKWHLSPAKISRLRKAGFWVWPSEVSSAPHVPLQGRDRSGMQGGSMDSSTQLSVKLTSSLKCHLGPFRTASNWNARLKCTSMCECLKVKTPWQIALMAVIVEQPKLSVPFILLLRHETAVCCGSIRLLSVEDYFAAVS